MIIANLADSNSSSEIIAFTVNSINKENTVKEAPTNPNKLISVAITSSLPYKGVPSSSSSSSTSLDLILPEQESLPTTNATKNPSPLTILVPESKIGDGILCPLKESS